jgi:diaminopimelate epimerase
MKFSKWHALGNAYLVLERADLPRPLDETLVRRLCDCRTGVGSDGIVEILASDGAEAELAIWNPDGSQAEMSGNGARIAARWLAQRSGADEVRLTIGDRELHARMGDGADVVLELGAVHVDPSERVDVDGESVELIPVSVGNPHAVVRIDFVDGDLERLGPRLERHSRFPGGTNVQLVRVVGAHELAIAIWERGAGPTRSSGSSSVAAAAAAVENGWCESPVTVSVHGGGALTVELAGGLARLTGPAEEICRGETAL